MNTSTKKYWQISFSLATLQVTYNVANSIFTVTKSAKDAELAGVIVIIGFLFTIIYWPTYLLLFWRRKDVKLLTLLNIALNVLSFMTYYESYSQSSHANVWQFIGPAEQVVVWGAVAFFYSLYSKIDIPKKILDSNMSSK